MSLEEKETKPAPSPGPRPISADTLRKIVGGRGTTQHGQIDTDKAVAMTAGTDFNISSHGGEKVELTKPEVTFGANGHFEIKMTSPAADGDSGHQTTVQVTGFKGIVESLKVTVDDGATKAHSELSRGDVSDRANANSALFKSIVSKIEATDSIGIKDVVTPKFKVNGKAAGPSGGGDTKSVIKFETAPEVVKLPNGQYDLKTPIKDKSSKDWTSAADTQRAANAKVPTETLTAAQGHLQSAAKDVEKMAARLDTVTKSAPHAHEADDGARQRSASSSAKLPGHAGGHDGPADAAKVNVAPAPPGMAAPKQVPATDHKPDAVKDRSGTMGGKPTGDQVQKQAVSAAQDAAHDAKAKYEAAKARVEQADKALQASQTDKAVKDGMIQKSKDDLRDWSREKGWSKSVDLAKQAFTDEGKKLAKSGNGSYDESNARHTLAGGAHESVNVSGNVKTTVESVGRVVTETGTVSYNSSLGGGAGANVAIRAEAGIKGQTAVTGEDGTVYTAAGQAYVGVGAEAGAKAGWVPGKAFADASATISAHAEASVSGSIKVGDLEVKQTISATGHAEAGAKAGASIGVDGVSVKAAVYAEAAIKANSVIEVTVGNVAVKNDLEVYAKAKAEAKAEMEVTFNPLGKDAKVVAKAGLGGEVTFGVGVKDTVGFKTANGSVAEVGGGLYAGKLGAKADVDLGYSGGKVAINLDVGASLGIGISVNVKVESNVKKAYSNAWDEVKSGNPLGVVSLLPQVAFIRGFFS